MARMDLSRMAAAAVEAALEPALKQEHEEDKPRRHGVTGMRAMAAGALLVVAARAAARKVPTSALMPAVEGLGDKVRDRVADKLSESGWLPGTDDADDLEDELPEDEFDDDEFDDD